MIKSNISNKTKNILGVDCVTYYKAGEESDSYDDNFTCYDPFRYASQDDVSSVVCDFGRRIH